MLLNGEKKKSLLQTLSNYNNAFDLNFKNVFKRILFKTKITFHVLFYLKATGTNSEPFYPVVHEYQR